MGLLLGVVIMFLETKLVLSDGQGYLAYNR